MWILLLLLSLVIGVHAADAQQTLIPKSNQTAVRITDDTGAPVYPGDATNKAIQTAPVVLQAGEDLVKTQFNASGVMVTQPRYGYETVAASQTDQVMGVTGAAGDILHVISCAYSADPSTGVSIKDGAGSAILVIPDTGAAGVQSTPALDVVSASGAWKVTTGTNTTCIVMGYFTP